MAERATKKPKSRGRGQVNRRENSRISAKIRRENENIEIYELARLLPLPSAVTSQLDKASVLRITISYFKMKEFFDKGKTDRQTDRQTDTHTYAHKTDNRWVLKQVCHCLNFPIADKGWLLGPLSIHPSQTYGKHGPCDIHDMPRLKALPSPSMDEHIDHYTLQALDGFIVVLSSAGNILYVSETVSGHLGHSQVDLLGRSLFEYSHIQDHEELKEALKPHTPCPGKKDMTSSGIGKRETTDRPSNGCSGRHVCCRNERNFFLRIKNSLSKKGGEKKGINCPGFKVIHLAGRIRFAHGEDENPSCLGLLAVCKPLDPPPMMEVSLSSNLFMSRHSMDMRFIFCDQRISQLTGYNPSDMLGRVVYHFHHPNDMSTIAGCHSNLISKGQSVSKSYRFLMKTGDWMWLQTKAVISYNTRSQKAQFITCYNYVVSEDEGKRQLLELGDVTDEWKKMRPVVELSELEPSQSLKKSVKKKQMKVQLPSKDTDVNMPMMAPKELAPELVPTSPTHPVTSNPPQPLPLLQPTTLTPSSKDSSHPVELDIFDESPPKLGEAIAQGYLATARRKSSDETQPLVMTDIPPDIIGASITTVVVTKRSNKKKKVDSEKPFEGKENPSTSEPPQSDLDGVMTELSLNIEEDMIHNMSRSPDDEVDVKPSCTNGLLPPIPGSYKEPCLQHHPICQTPIDDLNPVSGSEYPMISIAQQMFPPCFHAPAMTAPDVSNGMRYPSSGIHTNGVISNGQAWSGFPQSPMQGGPVIFSPGYPNLASHQLRVRRSGLETVHYSPYQQSCYRMTSSSGGSSCQMNGRRISPPESCAPHLANESLQ